MKAWHRAGRGKRWLLAVTLGLLGALAWLRGPSLAQQTPPVSPPAFNAPAAPPRFEEPPLDGAAPSTPPPSANPVPAPGPGPSPEVPAPAAPLPGATLPPQNLPSPYSPLGDAAGMVPMVPAPGAASPAPVMDPPPPQVILRVRVPARVAPGEKLTYRLLVENPAPARAHHVAVRDRLPPGARFDHAEPAPSEEKPDLLWKLGTLEPYARKEITLVVDPGGKTEIENHAYVVEEHGQTVRTQVARPGLRLHVSAPATARPVHTIDLNLEVTNDGQVEAKNVVLTSELPKGLLYVGSSSARDEGNRITWEIGTLPPGQRKSNLLQVMTREAGDYKLLSEVTATGGLRDTVHTTVKVDEGKLALAISGPASRRVDQPATYELTVTNTGKVASPGVEVVDRLVAGVIFLGASDGGQAANGEVRWRLGALPPGASRKLTCTFQAQGAGLFANVVRARDDMGLSALASASTRFSWLAVSMEPHHDAVPVGRQATLVFHVNNSSGRAVTKVGLTVTVPDSLSVVPLQEGKGARVEGGKVTFEPLPQLGPRETRAFSIQVQGVRAGKAMVRAEMITAEMTGARGSHFAQPLVCEEAVQVVEGQVPLGLTFNQR